MLGLFNSLGFFPDVLMGKKPKQALIDSVSSVAGASIGGPMGGAIGNAIGGAQQGGGLLKDVLGYAKPVGDALGMANQVNQLMQSNRPQIQAPMMQPQQAQDPIGGLLAQQMQLEEMRRRARGGYGAA
jgi:hypothetical protein